jgi:hypothetical protein
MIYVGIFIVLLFFLTFLQFALAYLGIKLFVDLVTKLTYHVQRVELCFINFVFSFTI